MQGAYQTTYQSWRDDPEAFWAQAAEKIDWITPPKTVFDPNQGVYGRWFVDGVMNSCHKRC